MRIKRRANLYTLLMILNFMLIIARASIGQRIIYVDCNAIGKNNGSSWEDAYKFLQDAMASAKSGEKPCEILVAEGTYRPDEDTIHPEGTGNRWATFHLINGVSIYGGFPSGGGQWEDRDPSEHETILSGDLNGDDGSDFTNNSENSYHVVTGSSRGPTAILDSFIITGGNANGYSYSDQSGGGMYNYSSRAAVISCTFSGNSAKRGSGMHNGNSCNPELINCTFNRNLAYSYGGGVFNIKASNPIMTNCTFSGNSAEYGGGMCNAMESNPELTNCTFSDNSANKEGGGIYNTANSNPGVTSCTFSGNSAEYGGGISNYDEGNPELKNCTFSGNSAELGGGMHNSFTSNPMVTSCTFSGNLAGYGGGMYNNNCNPGLKNCTFRGNSAEKGGGMLNWLNCSLELINCTFGENSAEYGGGMSNNNNSNPGLTNCIFSGNTAEHLGGGMENLRNSNPTVTSCTFSGNSAKYGGGICNWVNSNPVLINCTFSGNSAEKGGGLFKSFDSNAMVINCILWGNTTQQITGDIVVIYSDVQGGWAGEGNIDKDPYFVQPGYWANDDDPNIAVEPDDPNDIWIDGDYHLLADSSCINVGDPNYPPEPNETDIDGESRVMLGRVDMGADEFNPYEVNLVVVPRTLGPRGSLGTRTGRTTFEYDCRVQLKNVSRFAVKNVQLRMAKAPDNITIIDPNVSFGDVVINPSETAMSIDTCTFRVDRSEKVDMAQIIFWESKCEIAGAGQTIQQNLSSVFSLGGRR